MEHSKNTDHSPLKNTINRDILWIEKYKPKTLAELKFQDKIKIAQKWLSEIKSKTHKKVLLISGKNGTSKSLLANRIVESGDFHVKIFNATNLKSQNDLKQFNGFIKNNKIDGLVNRSSKGYGIIIDNIDYFDAVHLNSLVQIVAKCNTFIPLIFISESSWNKKLYSLKKIAIEIEMDKAGVNSLVSLIETIAHSEKLDIPHHVIKNIALSSQGDYRRCINILQSCAYNSEDYTKIYSKKELKVNCFDSAAIVLSKKTPISELNRIYQTDHAILPSMIYQNYISVCTQIKSQFINVLSTIDSIIESLAHSDNIALFNQNSECHCLSSVVLPNIAINKFPLVNNLNCTWTKIIDISTKCRSKNSTLQEINNIIGKSKKYNEREIELIGVLILKKLFDNRDKEAIETMKNYGLSIENLELFFIFNKLEKFRKFYLKNKNKYIKLFGDYCKSYNLQEIDI
jgi:DNA polymerase III delta prime subunit